MSEIITGKRCSHCKRIKPILEFYKDRSRPDGLFSWCKICHNTKMKAYLQTPKGKIICKKILNKYRQTEKGKATQKRYQQSDKGKIVSRKQKTKYLKKFPKRHFAHIVITNAVGIGKLLPAKTLKCVYCGKPAQQYHHWKGYSPKFWLDVVPACRLCDKKAHKKTVSNPAR